MQIFGSAKLRFSTDAGYFQGPPERVPLSLHSINARLAALRVPGDSKPYQKQESNLQRGLKQFLYSLPTPKSVYDTSL